MSNIVSFEDFKKKNKANLPVEENKNMGSSQVVSFQDFKVRNTAQGNLKNSAQAKFYNYITQPKQTETASDKRNTWFNTGAEGNILQKGLGTVADVGYNVLKGVASAGEKLGDLASYGVAGVADVLGAKDYAQSVREAAQVNLVGNALQPVTNQVNKYSLTGDKLDSIMQSVGESYAMSKVGGALGKTKTAQKLGLGDALNKQVKIGKLNINIPLMSVLTGASSGITEAYQKGGDNQQAFIRGITSGLAEGISEGIFGVFGQGGSSFEQEVMYKATKKIENDLARRLTKKAITAFGEGAEEGISYAFNYVADNLQDIINTSLGKEINKMGDKWDWKEFGENILSGTIAGGISAGAEGLFSGKGAAILESTQHQVENRLNRALSDAELVTLEDVTRNQLNNGKINVDEIVNRLQNPTVEDLVAQNNIKQDTTPQLDTGLQQTLSSRYTTDTTNYTGTQLQTYQNAINSGLLNNNKNTHDFVDFVSKISKDKGIVFNFTNNQGLQDRNIDAQINGFIDENGITLNIDSTMALEKVIGHEITHTLENMVNEYNDLKNSFKQLLGEEEFNTRVQQIEELYKKAGITNANYENELISDLAGEYLFTNEEFINRLSTEKPSLFKRIYNEIKYLWKLATGTEQEKQLARTMRIYEQAYKNAGKATGYRTDTFAQKTQTTPQETVQQQEIKEETKPEVKKYPNLTEEESKEYEFLDSLPFDLTGEDLQTYERLQRKMEGKPNLPTRKDIQFKDIARDYGKYKDLEGYNAELTKDAESLVPDRNGKRTKEQWLDVASFIGERFKGTNEQLKKYAIQSWLAERPNNKDRLNRQGKGFVKFTIEEWLNKIYESANRTKPITQYSLSQEETKDLQTRINESMTMNDMKRILDMAYAASDIEEYSDGEVKSVEEWLENENWNYQIPLIAENTQEITEKYLNRIGEDSGYGEDFTFDDILEAYKNGTLTGKPKKGRIDLDTSLETGRTDNRFYAPQNVELTQELYDTANQRVTKTNREQVYKARADFVIAAHNTDNVEQLGLSQQEVNKKIREWANYPKDAMQISQKVNEGVARENQWSGLENSSIVNYITITDEQLSSMVKEIKGKSDEFERKYITSAMLALDTHIDYSSLTFEFGQRDILKQKHANGDYNYETDTIRVGDAYQNTVAHEMGHYLNSKWARDIFGSNPMGSPLSDLALHYNEEIFKLTPEQKQFVDNFTSFIDDLTDSAILKYGNNRDMSYWQNRDEVFARFVAQFTEWTKNKATNGRFNYESQYHGGFGDAFTQRQYEEFVKILQEKSALETMGDRARIERTNAKYSLSTAEEMEKYNEDRKNVFKQLDKDFGGGTSIWEANLDGKNYDESVRYLKQRDSVKRKFAEENNIKVEDVMKPVEYRVAGNRSEETQNYIRDNNITMEKLINEPETQKQYFTQLENAMLQDENWTQEEIDDYLTKFNDYFETQRQRGNNEDIIWPLLRFQNDIENITNNNTEVVDTFETSKREKELIDNNPKFDKYVKKYADKLFKTKPVLDAEEVMEEAKSNHGTTNNYEVGAYMTTDGSLLNFNDHGYRDDHRTISAFDLDMNEFMNYGAIRMKPESNGFEIAIEPTTEQYNRLYDYINDYAKNNSQNGDIVVDIDIPNTMNYDSAVYNLDTPTSKIINDIKTYFETGKFPQKSEYADFYYSLSQKQENLPIGQFRGKDVRRDINVPTTQENALNVPLNRQKRVLNPTEISNLTPVDANTTPILPTTRTLTGDKQSRFLNNLNQTEMLSQESKDLINNANIGDYKSVTNEESLKDASEKLSKGGKAETERWFRNDPKNVNATDIAEGFILLNQYQEIAKNSNNAADKYQANQSMVEVAKKLRQIGTEAGQTLQAYSILSRMTPEGMVYYAQSELTDAYNEMVKNKSREWINQNRSNFELTPEETQFILDTMNEVSTMEDGYEKKVKLAEIQKLMTDKLPPAKGQKIKSWMRLSMLFNPKTQVRNVAGNTLIVPVNSFSDIFASYADKLISRKTGKRTTGTTNIKAMLEGFKKGAYEATTDYRKGINTRDIEGNRFEMGEGKSFSDKSIIGKALNNTEGLLNYVMDAGDRVFSEAAFENSLQNQLKLNNTNEITQDMIDIARQEALSRTWNDNNNYTKFVLNVRSMLNKINFGTYGLGDVLIPFAKTPANLTKAIVDYSPVGFVNTLLKGQKLNRSLENGQYTPQLQHDFVQTLGKATAGTMLYVLGMALAKAGITSGESDEDKDTQNFLKNTLGISNYSIKIGNKSFTYDWAQPIAAPLSITANIEGRKDKEQALGEAILSNLDTSSSVLLEQSFMQGINEVLNGNGGIVDGMIKQVLELPARAVPTLSKQIVDLTDSTQRTSYEYNKPVESAINAVKAKIPGLSQTLAPVVDTMGREVQRYGGKNNLFNVFLNPANVNTENISEAASEIYEVYKATGDKTIMPRVAPYYINQKGEKITLNSKQKAQFQTISGNIIEENMNDLINNQAYQNLNDTEKASMINDIVNYAYNKARKDVLNIDMSNTYNKINEFIKDGGTPAEYYTNKEEIDYAYANPNKYSTIRQITTYNMYQTYNNAIKDIKTKYSTSDERKNAIINYVNGLELGIPQKAMLIRMNYSSFKQYDNQIIQYINSQDLTVEQKSAILKEIGFTIKNGVVYN